MVNKYQIYFINLTKNNLKIKTDPEDFSHLLTFLIIIKINSRLKNQVFILSFGTFIFQQAHCVLLNKIK